MHERLLTDAFCRAAQDYRFLVERRYSRASALKLVGDRYQLTAVHRSMLYRGVASMQEAATRGEKLTDEVQASSLHVDGLNVLYTIANYLYGRVLFVSTDGWLRDAGEVHGEGIGPPAKRGTILANAVSLLIDWLAERRPSEVELYVDEPVSLSGELAAHLRRALSEAKISGTARTVPSADFALKHVVDAVVATSDSTIIDACRCKVCDVAHRILDERFAPQFVDLRTILP